MDTNEPNEAQQSSPSIEESVYQENSQLKELSDSIKKAKQEIGKVLVGMDTNIDLIYASLLCGGHVLLEGVPGIAKTLLTKLIAKSLDADFSRVQFTPDLMPSDVIGTSIFDMKNASFEFKKGPIFSNIVLIDEINRAPAKTQAALFEVMEEAQITVDSTTYPMEPPFFVMATQNPIEQEGTYKLPEAQLDRFLVKLYVDYPSYEEEVLILERFQSDFKQHQLDDVKPVLTKKKVAELQKQIEGVFIKKEIIDYIAQLVSSTRTTNDLFLGASPRASLALLKLSKAIAGLNGRNFVIPDDVKYVANSVLNHRIILTAEKEMEGTEVHEVIDELVGQIEIPR
ncbi:MAG: AAA family ATPase [Cyclobacteriaceae bacterium]